MDLSDLKKKIFVSIIVLCWCRFGSFIPIPGVDIVALQEILAQKVGGLFGVFNLFSGGAFGRLAIFSLSVTPYVVASIIVQLVKSSMKNSAYFQEASNSDLAFYVKLFTACLCVLQGTVMVFGLQKLGSISGLALYEHNSMFLSTAVISLLGGTMFLIWMGDQITKNGLGNGVSLIIMVGIISELPAAFLSVMTVKNSIDSPFVTVALPVVCFMLLWFIVFVERSFRKVIVQYPKRQSGNKVYGSGMSHIPIKLNVAGVIPPIFASALLILPVTLSSFMGSESVIASYLNLYFSPGKPLYLLCYALLIISFCFFYSEIAFDTESLSQNLKKSNGFIAGRRPGKSTQGYLKFVVLRITFWGSLYLSFVCVAPELFRASYAIPFTIGSTSLLIVVHVIMDLMATVQSYFFSNSYNSMLSNFRG